MASLKQTILQRITRFYLDSRDFNGMPLFDVARIDVAWMRALRALVREGKVSVVFGDRHPNAHIKAFPSEPIEEQLTKLKSNQLELPHVCAYPTQAQLATVITQTDYADEPFTRRLALGAAQLDFESFDLSVLEYYRNDPRYHYSNDDISGSISYSADALPSHSRDSVVLQTFGFSYDEELNRAAAVFLRYLADLSPEHQQIWNAKILTGTYYLHPDYRRSTLGEWPEGISIFDAFGSELHHINEMCRLMGRPPLFRREYREDQKPREFSFLIRPTLKEFNSFVLVLDKALSENIDRAFFQNEVAYETEHERKDGKVIVQPKGTIQILDDWWSTHVRPTDPRPLADALAAFREVRTLRQRPAHAVEEDQFDLEFFRRQRELMVRAYAGVRTLRLLFANHPRVRGYEVEDWLATGQIWTY